MKIFAVCGNMGGNTICLLNGALILKKLQQHVAQMICSPQYGGIQEVAFVYPAFNADCMVEVYEPTVNGLIQMCGGAVSVLGLALQKKNIRSWFGVRESEFREFPNRFRFVVNKEVGIPGLTTVVKVDNGKISVDMTEFANAGDILELELSGQNVTQVGTFMVVDADKIPFVTGYGFNLLDTNDRDGRQVREHLERLHEEFVDFTGVDENNVVLFQAEETPNLFRATFPHDVSTMFMEASCGTGCVALGLAIISEQFKNKAGILEVLIECGGDAGKLGGPDKAMVTIEYDEDSIISAWYSHDNIRITSEGYFYFD